jgi:predicted DNA-binding helix-hairpin-helix protein
MDVIRETIAETREDRKRLRHVPAFAPAGQSTQLIVGASPESDFEVLALADRLYRQQSLKRVYYSAYVPVCPAGGCLPDVEEPPLQRENRLYQADWLMRLYGFSRDEVISRTSPWLDLEIDPKQAFACRHPELFPVDINTADREMILRVPGIGLKTANRIVGLAQKRTSSIRTPQTAGRRCLPRPALHPLRRDGNHPVVGGRTASPARPSTEQSVPPKARRGL